MRILDLSYETFRSCDILIKGLPNLRSLETSEWTFLPVRKNFLGWFPMLESFTSENCFLVYGFHNHENKNFLTNSTNLQHISLYGNNLKFLPPIFVDPVVMPLKALNISNNIFSDILLEVYNFKHFEIVDIRNNMIKTIESKQREWVKHQTWRCILVAIYSCTNVNQSIFS